jgi:hypothetical protein
MLLAEPKMLILFAPGKLNPDAAGSEAAASSLASIANGAAAVLLAEPKRVDVFGPGRLNPDAAVPQAAVPVPAGESKMELPLRFAEPKPLEESGPMREVNPLSLPAVPKRLLLSPNPNPEPPTGGRNAVDFFSSNCEAGLPQALV